MKLSKPVKLAFAFFLDSMVINIVSGLIATFFNPYDNALQNSGNKTLIYLATLFVYIIVAESKFKTTIGKKAMKLSK